MPRRLNDSRRTALLLARQAPDQTDQDVNASLAELERIADARHDLEGFRAKHRVQRKRRSETLRAALVG